MYRLHLWKAMMGKNGPENGTETHDYIKKPTFEDMYKHIGCDMIEILHGYDKDISGRTFDIYCDEESKLKSPFIKNDRATKAWYTWQERTGRTCIEGDFIAGNVAIIEKVKDEAA